MAKDPNEFARSILDTIIAKHDPESVTGKDPKKVASGLRGGSKGGRKRAENQSKKKLREIGQKGAKARWES